MKGAECHTNKQRTLLQVCLLGLLFQRASSLFVTDAGEQIAMATIHSKKCDLRMSKVLLTTHN